jgi:hypothetical protein
MQVSRLAYPNVADMMLACEIDSHTMASLISTHNDTCTVLTARANLAHDHGSWIGPCAFVVLQEKTSAVTTREDEASFSRFEEDHTCALSEEALGNVAVGHDVLCGLGHVREAVVTTDVARHLAC